MGFEPTRAEPNRLAVHRHNLSATSPALQATRAADTLVSKTDYWENKKKLCDSTRMGFEPTWAEPIGLAVNRHNLSATLSTSHPIHAAYIIVSKTDHWENKKKLHDTTKMGFELTRVEHDDLAVHRLNLSATLSALQAIRAAYTLVSNTDHWEKKKSYATRRGWDSNPRGQSSMD
ncbi:hypothetical protein MRX96_015328 [Rhipicephalus microplus]